MRAKRSHEPLEPAQIRARQEKCFASLIRQVLKSNTFYRGKFLEAGFKEESLTGPSALVRLPLTTASELRADREANPPFGTNLTFPLSRYTRVHDHRLDTADSWSWWLDCWARAYEAAGLAPEDRVLVACSGESAIGSRAALEAGQRLGALTAAGAAGDDSIDTMRACETTVVVATPEETGRLLAAIEGGSHQGVCPERWIVFSEGVDPDVDALASMLESDFSARCFPATLSREAGLWGFGCEHGSLHVNEAEFIAEVIDPRTGDRVPPDPNRAQRGELVLTSLGRVGSPVIRFATGAAVELSGQACPCGHPTRRLLRDEVSSARPRSRRAAG